MTEKPLNISEDMDDLLKILVSIVNKNQDDGPSITLAIGGMLVSGVLVSADRYFRIAGVTEIGGSDKERDSIQIFLRDEREDPRHVHLKGPRFFLTTSAAPIAQDDQLFRVKLSAVDGFIPGRFEATVVSK